MGTDLRVPWVRMRQLVRELVRETLDDRVLGLAAEVAFFAVFSLFPGLLLAAGMVSYLDDLVGADVARAAQQQVTDFLNRMFTDQAAPLVESVEAVFEGHYGGLLTFAAVGALVTLSGAWAVLIEALNLAYDVEELRSWYHRRIVGLVLGVATLVVVALTLSVVVVGPLFGHGEQLADLLGLGSVFAATWDLVRLPVLFVLLTGWLMAVFHFAPNRTTSWRSAVPGAVLTGLLWLLATAGFHLYLALVGDRNPLLGAFGGGVIVMGWAYLLSVALLLGGEFNALLGHRRIEEGDRSGEGRRPIG